MGDIANFYGGALLPEGKPFVDQPNGYPLLRVSDLNLPQNEKFIRTSRQWSNTQGAKSATAPAGSLIIPKRGGAIGTNKKRITTRPCMLDPNLMAIWPHPDKLNIGYLYHWFLTFDLADIVTGSSVPQLNKQDLAPLKLPLAPLDEQRRIAEILDQVDELRAKRRSAIALLDDLAQSIFLDMFGDPMSNDRKWNTLTIGEAGLIQLGRQRAPKYQTGKYTRPYMRVANVFEDRIDTSDILSMDFDQKDFTKYRLTYGDILLNEGQSTELVGRPAMWRNEIQDCCFQNTLVRFRPQRGMVASEYALAVFIRYFRTGQFAKISSKTSSMAHLGASRFAAMPFPLPDLDMQRKFTAKVEVVRALQASHRCHLAQLDRLSVSLQDRAFRGEL